MSRCFAVFYVQSLQHVESYSAPSCPMQCEVELKTLEVVHRLNHPSQLLKHLIRRISPTCEISCEEVPACRSATSIVDSSLETYL